MLATTITLQLKTLTFQSSYKRVPHTLYEYKKINLLYKNPWREWFAKAGVGTGIVTVAAALLFKKGCVVLTLIADQEGKIFNLQ